MFLLSKSRCRGGGFNPSPTPLPGCKNEVRNSQGRAVLQRPVVHGGAIRSPALVRARGLCQGRRFCGEVGRSGPGGRIPCQYVALVRTWWWSKAGRPCWGSSGGELWVLTCFRSQEMKAGKGISAWF